MKATTIKKLDSYIKNTFNNDNLSVRARPEQEDSCEFYLNDEFLGLIYEDNDEDGETSYNLSMSILDIDLK